MLLKENRQTFRCPKYSCRKEISIWAGSFFFHCKIPCNDVLNLAYLWVCGSTHSVLCSATGHTHETVTAFMGYFRELVATCIEEDGGVERTPEKRLFVCRVPDRSAATIADVIYRHVRPGTRILTDCWRSYDWLDSDSNFVHEKVNHLVQFKVPNTDIHTNSIEGTWAGLKSKIPKRNRAIGQVDSYLLTYIWRRQNKENLWNSFIEAMVTTHYFN